MFIENLKEFLATFSQAVCIEEVGGYMQYSNGVDEYEEEEEDLPYQSAWFNSNGDMLKCRPRSLPIATLDEFMDTYPESGLLEVIDGYSRYTDGLEEGSEHESMWFDVNENMLECRPDSI